MKIFLSGMVIRIMPNRKRWVIRALATTAPLDALGRSQAEQTARDPRLKQGR
ncbi:MAG: hypothetical protein ACLSFJ_00230 [Holdemania filiformis]